MNKEAKEVLSHILEKNPSELTESEVLFLRARRSYLKNTQLKEYESVLVVEEKEENGDEPTEFELKLQEARDLGYDGPLVSTKKLIEYIEEHKEPNPNNGTVNNNNATE